MRGWIRLCTCAISLAVILVPATWATPEIIVIQGVLTNANTQPLSGTRAWSIQFYDSAAGGAALGAALTGTVTVAASGRWSIALAPPSAVTNATGNVYYQLGIDSAAVPDGAVDPGDFFSGRVRVESALFAQVSRQLAGARFIMVPTGSDSAANGTALLAAYATAKTMSPVSTSRVPVIVPPGQYNLGTSSLTLDTDFIDLTGLTGDHGTQKIFGSANGPDTGVLMQTASDVHIENLNVICNRGAGALSNSLHDPAAYWPDATWNIGANRGSPAATTIKGCKFQANDETRAVSMRLGIEYAGSYKDCTAGANSFGGTGGIASGSFGGCSGDNGAFGGNGGAASGAFFSCQGKNDSFGATGTASGTFVSCQSGLNSFGNGGNATNGRFEYCIGNAGSFGGSGSSPAPVYLFCILGNAHYAGNQ